MKSLGEYISDFIGGMIVFLFGTFMIPFPYMALVAIEMGHLQCAKWIPFAITASFVFVVYIFIYVNDCKLYKAKDEIKKREHTIYEYVENDYTVWYNGECVPIYSIDPEYCKIVHVDTKEKKIYLADE